MPKNNKMTKTVRSLYFEKQKPGNTCRLHAINNAFGQSILSLEKFFEYCDEFDMKNHCNGSREFFFVHSNNNIISFILNKFHVQNSYYPPYNPPNVSEELSDDIMSVIVFDDGHIWCIKKHNNTWYNLDSLSNGPKLIEFETIFTQNGFGWILVSNNNTNSTSSDQSSNSNNIDQLPTSLSKRSSKRYRMKENHFQKESFEIFDRTESN